MDRNDRSRELRDLTIKRGYLLVLKMLGWPDWSEEQVNRALDSLTPNQSWVIHRRFGLLGDAPWSLDETGKHWSEWEGSKVPYVTRERVRLVEARALERLRRWVENDNAQ